MAEIITGDDCRTFEKYLEPGTGAWTAMPEPDKAAYRKVHLRLEQIVREALAGDKLGEELDHRLTLGFNPSGGVRGVRPKDLWCATFPRGAEAFMPQVYLIVSHRGAELGFAAVIHPSDFTNPQFRTKVRRLAPLIFDALPPPGSDDVRDLTRRLEEASRWHYRLKARLEPNGDDFPDLEGLLTFLKSPDGRTRGAGTIARYWLPEELDGSVDLGAEFAAAVWQFYPLLDDGRRAPGAVTDSTSDLGDPAGAPEPTTDAGGTIRGTIERFLALYPETRAGKAFGVDRELWGVLEDLKRALAAAAPLRKRPHVQVRWSVGQGNWATVPWVALLDERVTTSTRRGVYGVLLFREDMTGAYLTYNQGVTQPKKDHGATAGLQLLRENARALREGCPELAGRGFRLDDEIDLRTDAGLGRDYEVSTIAHKLYERGAVPDDAAIADDLEALLAAYDRHVEGRRSTDDGPADDEVPPLPERPLPEAPAYALDDALADLLHERGDLEDMLEHWRMRRNLVLEGPPGVGKTFLARRLAWLLMGRRDTARLRMVQFHQAYAYEDFVQGFRPSKGGGFERRDGVFFDFCKLAEADPRHPYVFVVDEINRGNLAKILGELLMLIEGDKRGPDYALRLAYSRPDEAPFSVPPNLHLLGLMNTADRSLAMVDYALRRRFGFFPLEPRFASPRFRELLEARGAAPELVSRIVERVTELNAAIAADKTNLGPGYQVGHSFFVPAEGTVCDAAWYRRVVRYEVAPLLREYWFDDPDRAEGWAARLLDGLG